MSIIIKKKKKIMKKKELTCNFRSELWKPNFCSNNRLMWYTCKVKFHGGIK